MPLNDLCWVNACKWGCSWKVRGQVLGYPFHLDLYFKQSLTPRCYLTHKLFTWSIIGLEIVVMHHPSFRKEINLFSTSTNLKWTWNTYHLPFQIPPHRTKLCWKKLCDNWPSHFCHKMHHHSPQQSCNLSICTTMHGWNFFWSIHSKFSHVSLCLS